jgi:hypothetical protein
VGYVAFPLRFRGALLERCDRTQAVLALIEAMARTARGSWAGSGSFGIRDLLAASQRPGALQEAVRQINLALLDLGIDFIRAESVQLESLVGGEGHYLITFSSGPGRTHSLRVKQPE